MPEEADVRLFAEAVADAAASQFPDAKPSGEWNTNPDEDLAAALGSIIEQDEPEQALKIVEQVISYVEEGGDHLTLQDVDRALDVSDQLVKFLKKEATREKRQSTVAEGELTFTDRVQRFFGGENEHIKKARIEAKQAEKAGRKAEKSRDQNTRLDDAIDDMIITQVCAISPSFKIIVESQDELVGVLKATDGVKDAADSLESAGVTDVVDVDMGNNVVNMAMEMSDNLLVSAARDEVEEAVKRLNAALRKFNETDFEATRSAFAEFVDSIDATMELLDTTDGFGAFDALDLIGALQTMDDAADIRGKALEIEAAFEHRLKTAERFIMGVVENIRVELGIQ